ncbi:GldL-related protein [Mangrovibacterium marinum]|uniref:Gliding motility protein GldL-like N-terminal domain-containing protein n=1 Tax=Mangrovibacterium marinum TaxID=1639118 RepID=A0A2T5C0J7_9BACT|nr:hypothetical protein [Mangrovibacterium marinum]PTN08090.1 hypothetical protein C8N47_111131 [Mangrovibacterium marinum]
MTRTQTDKLMGLLLNSSAALILIGAFFKLQHYPYGTLLLDIGFIAALITASCEISRLKKIIRKLEGGEQDPNS